MEHREQRTGLQWLKSAIAYCQWRSGGSWRPLAQRRHRDSAERWWYLDGARALSELIYLDEGSLSLQLVLPALQVAPSPNPLEKKLATQSRSELVDALIDADPRYTDRRLLSGLSRRKLAGMVVRALDESQAERRRA